MNEQERSKPHSERVEDLEVRDDEARDIAGGKQKNPYRFGKKAAGRKAALYPHKKEH